ncbi:4-carboxymuconolactone decarboxylase [Rhodococcus sp. 15-1154-1]|nr:carboxymuconolactone decarboxylase family protein [Rhodococcus sp. 15-1154-1]OZF07822.1 4-carboxymuconolactone decarboxylase [Rhodococcus sp. 15-1154-1]
MERSKKLLFPVVVAAVSMLAVACGDGVTGAQDSTNNGASRSLDAVAPALQHYNETVVEENLWNRENLSVRDRSLVTVSALIARNQAGALAVEIERGLDNGLEPAEISEIITHLAFYASWPNALAAAEAARPVFEARGVDPAQLPGTDVELLAQDPIAEQQRASSVDSDYGSTAPGVVQFTTDTVFGDLWLRPGLAPRDRSLATVGALVATGQVAQITFHLGRAMDNGLTAAQASEALTQLAFYAGWPNVFSALPVVRNVLDARQ